MENKWSHIRYYITIEIARLGTLWEAILLYVTLPSVPIESLTSNQLKCECDVIFTRECDIDNYFLIIL